VISWYHLCDSLVVAIHVKMECWHKWAGLPNLLWPICYMVCSVTIITPPCTHACDWCWDPL